MFVCLKTYFYTVFIVEVADYAWIICFTITKYLFLDFEIQNLIEIQFIKFTNLFNNTEFQ